MVAITLEEKKLSLLFNALSDPNRRRILKLLLGRREPCVSELALNLNVSVPAVSQHLRILEMSGLVTRERRGQMVCYKVNKEDSLIKLILKMI